MWSYCSRVDINNQQMPFLSDFEFKQTLLKNFYKCFRKKNHFAHQINFMSKNQYSMTQLYWSFYKRRKEEYNRGKSRGGSFMHALHLCFMLLTSPYLPVATKTRIYGGFEGYPTFDHFWKRVEAVYDIFFSNRVPQCITGLC